MNPKLALHEISKSFPGVRALAGVSLELAPGEVHALVGENGAGKSTLIKIISGAIQPDGGHMILDRNPYRPADPAQALRLGVAAIYQEKNQLPDRSALMNVMLGREPARPLYRLDFKAMRDRARAALARLGADNLPLDARADDLGPGPKQIIGIARALVSESSLLIMDEPTSALNHAEREALFKVIAGLKRDGITILYISHRLDEIFRVADRVTALRDGQRISTAAVSATGRDRLIADMIGRRWEGAFPEKNPELGPVVLEADGLGAAPFFADVSFTLRAGEVLGIAGLAGSGKDELAQALFRALPANRGRVTIAGRELGPTPVRAIAQGMAYVPADRKKEGTIAGLSVGRNISLPMLSRLAGWTGHVRRSDEHRLAETWVKKLDIKTPSLTKLCGELSGGNQQKVALAKWLAAQARVLILAHPTQEIDVGVKFELYNLIAELARAGTAIILVSSELEELIGVCHRIMVMRDGRTVTTLAGGHADPETILRLALGQERDRGGQSLEP